MFDKIVRKIPITLPDPIKCTGCEKGMLVPIFRPCRLSTNGYAMFHTDNAVQEGINEVIWKCTECDKTITNK